MENVNQDINISDYIPINVSELIENIFPKSKVGNNQENSQTNITLTPVSILFSNVKFIVMLHHILICRSRNSIQSTFFQMDGCDNPSNC